MATEIYNIKFINLIDGLELCITPLKIKFLRAFMDAFDLVKESKNDDEAMQALSYCATIAMKQYHPEIKTVEDLEDSIDLQTMYQILDVAAGIKINGKNTESPIKEQAASGTSWKDLDIAKLESEVFLLGIWKNYEELESSISMPELLSILEAKRDFDYNEKRFMAGLNGIDLDEQVGKKEEDPWEAMKARVFSGGSASNSNDIVSLQGAGASRAGFGVGLGLDYEDMR
jgi:hypothetical protein